MYNDKNIKNNNQTKICKCCGRELPLSSFAKSGKKYTRKICKSCENKQRREKREDNRFSNGIEQYQMILCIFNVSIRKLIKIEF